MKYPEVPLLTSAAAASVENVEIVNVSKLIEARKQDIAEFLNVLAQGRKHNRSFQKLPYHQRRRAMSHNPFRVPKRYRLPVVIDLLNGRKIKRKGYRIKWRKDLRIRRFGENKWLTTHIFHAKRFKMVNIWGYKLAETPTSKCQRRIYRSLNGCNGCLMYDKSYFSLFSSITANRGISALNSLIIRKAVLFYDIDGKLISPIHIMQSADDGSFAISIHPAAKAQFMEYIRNFSGNLERNTAGSGSNRVISGLLESNIPGKLDDISHFELLGPRSLGIMCKIFRLKEFKENDYFTDKDCRLAKNSPNGSIFHLKIGLPNSAYNKFDSVESEDLIRKSLGRRVTVLTKSGKGRLNVTVLERAKDKLQSIELGEKSQNSSFEDTLENIETYEILVITRHLISSFKPYKRVSGFDILMPSQISRYIWNKLYKSGGLPIGLQERRKIYLELGQLIFPEDYPETLSGYQYHNIKDKERNDNYLKLSSRHRLNYDKLDVAEPLSVINLLSLLSNKCNKFTKSKFIHTIVTSVKRGVPREMCRIYLVNAGRDFDEKKLKREAAINEKDLTREAETNEKDFTREAATNEKDFTREAATNEKKLTREAATNEKFFHERSSINEKATNEKATNEKATGKYEEVGVVISGSNTFTRGKGFAKCVLLGDIAVEGGNFMARNINSRHYFPVEVKKVDFNYFID